jgi:hypothetical protein
MWVALGRCATAARQPLELIILVRIQAPQPAFPARKRGFFSENGPRAVWLAAQVHFYFLPGAFAQVI